MVDIADAQLSEGTFTELARRIHLITGIKLGPAKRQLVQSRLSRRLRALSLGDFDAYLEQLDAEPSEVTELVSAITTNLTHFFREPHHFETLIPILRERPGLQRVWSAACSTGEEPYSIAMAVQEAGISARIRATDIDNAVLAQARAGVYDAERLGPVSLERKKRFFERGTGSRAGQGRVKAELRAIVEMEPLNLIGAWTAPCAYDAIFCRNVLIYFDSPTQLRLVRRLVEALRVGGVLFLGHSESLREADARLKVIGHTSFRRVA